MEEKKYRCAYCEGQGKDPFGVLSEASTCSICQGKGKVRLIGESVAGCGFCKGSGKHPIERLSCPACKGYGMFESPKDAVTCSQCLGSGKREDEYFPCSRCHGKGKLNQAA